jgi:hypothetical protein
MRRVVPIGTEIIRRDIARRQSKCCASGFGLRLARVEPRLGVRQRVWSIATAVSAIEVGRVFQALQVSLLRTRKRVECIHDLRGIPVWHLRNVQGVVEETDNKAIVRCKWPLCKVEVNASSVDNGDSGSSSS